MFKVLENKYLFLCYFSIQSILGQIADFNYREPYFLEVNTPSFSKKNNTHILDEEWGIWGHNLSQLINKNIHTEEVFALVNNERNKNQLCFSSNEIEHIIIDEATNTNKQKFVIAPQDNALVCQCLKCLSAGNTEKDASPAVFNLLKKLALQKPKLDFYTIAYTSIIKPPTFSIPENVGVFYSTIKFQNGIPYQKQKNINTLKKELSLWSEKTSKIIIWDYALNFDNYHDFYPNLSVTQQNLSFFKSINIEGVFFNGSEEYALLQDVKTTMLAKLLWNSTINLDEEISTYINNNYPKEISDVLIPYYLNIEKTFLSSGEKQGIYSNIKQAEIKHLNIESFLSFYDQLTKAYHNLKTAHLNSSKLLASLTYLKLEVIREKGINKLTKSSKKDIINLLSFLNKEINKTNIHFINEQKNDFKKYIRQWYKLLFKPSVKNHFLSKNLKIVSALDDDYKDTAVLNDGKFGFLDYNTNWLIITKDDLIIELNEEQLTKGKNIIFSFLNDPKHHIYFPENIAITTSEKTLFTKEILSSLTLERKEFSIPVAINDLPKQLFINVKRKARATKNALACDEIILKN